MMNNVKLAIISGSHRETSESGKLAEYIQKIIQSTAPFQTQFDSHILDLAKHKLPFFADESTPEEKQEFEQKWLPVSSDLNESDAFIIISPEWNGMVPSQLKNLFLLTNREFYHKPALIVTVSASMNGAYPVAELRMSSYKNSRLLYIPEHLIIRNIQDFNADPDHENFTEIRERMLNDLNILHLYASKLQGIGKEVLALEYTEKYPNGM